ncbi:MAG: HAD family hydrolase [Cyclobacteriaceae bacterium]
MINTVIFDMDGVIIDSEPIHRELQQQKFNELGITISAEQYQGFVGTSAKNMWQQLIREHGLDISLEALLEADIVEYRDYLLAQTDLKPIEGIVPLLDQLQELEFQILLASSATPQSIQTVMDIFNLHDYFLHKVSGATLTHSKPHPEIFEVSARLGQVAARQCVVIEDSTNGIKAAKAASMKCIGFQNPQSGEQDLSQADWVVNAISEIQGSLLRDL